MPRAASTITCWRIMAGSPRERKGLRQFSITVSMTVNPLDNSIGEYICHQIRFFGRLSAAEKKKILAGVPAARQQTQGSLNRFARIEKKINLLHAHHSMIFLYRLANVLRADEACATICEKLFLLNRMQNGLDLYYKIEMPEHFLIGHGLGTVFSKAVYGNYLVVFQNVTIGVQDGKYPSIGENAVIYSNCIIAGESRIGKNCVVGAGTRLINKTIPDNSIVLEKDGKLLVKDNTRNETGKYFIVEE